MTAPTARQEVLIETTRAAGVYIAGVYRETASGARPDRPELDRLIGDLQPGDIVVAERMDRLSRLPLPEAEALIARNTATGARLAIPGVVNLADLITHSDGVARIVLEAVQSMLLRLALQMSRDDYETRRERQAQGIVIAQAAGKYHGRTPDAHLHALITQLRTAGSSIAATARLAQCSTATVKTVWSKNRPKS